LIEEEYYRAGDYRSSARLRKDLGVTTEEAQGRDFLLTAIYRYDISHLAILGGLPMDVRSIILGFLMYGSMTGYELKKFFSISFSFFSGLSYGSIYPALRRMEEEGLITMRVQVQDGSPNRKIYTITGKGRSTFVEALKAPFAFERNRSAFLTRLFFFAHLSPGERLENATRHLESVKEIQSELESARPEIEAHADPFQKLCFEFGRRFFRDLVTNISCTIDALRETGQTAPAPRRRRSHGKAF
jgi:DNA-binding PadR family transcriptional regulator